MVTSWSYLRTSTIKESEKAMDQAFTNEFDLDDSIERDVAVESAVRVKATRDLRQAELDWYADNFREFFHGGATHNTTAPQGFRVVVNRPNSGTLTLIEKAVEEQCNISFATHPHLYKTNKPRKQAVSFHQLIVRPDGSWVKE